MGSETVRGIAAEMRANAFGKKTLVDGRIHALTYYEGPQGIIGNQWLFSEYIYVLSSPFVHRMLSSVERFSFNHIHA